MESPIVLRRESIILTAVEMIHEAGIRSVSTKEIAKKLGISESVIFKHFPKKNDLLFAVLEQFSLYDRDMFYAARMKTNPVEGILFYFDSFVTYYENYPAITALLQSYDEFRGIPELEDKTRSIYQNRLEFIKERIRKAQEAGLLSRNADTDTLAVIFSSTYRGICLEWRISDYCFSLQEKMIQAIGMLLNAFQG